MDKEKEGENVTERKSGNGADGDSIFDEAFRKMIEGLPPLVISLVNEMFGTDYAEDEEVVQLRNEHHEVNGTLIADALVEIHGKLFHIECRSSKDGTMSLRMIEYDFAIAFERAKKEPDGRCHVRIPDSCVLYIRNHRSVPEYHEVVVEMPDGRELTYRAKTMQARDYSADQIIEKNLHILAPFHILRREAFVKSGRKDASKLEELAKDMSWSSDPQAW